MGLGADGQALADKLSVLPDLRRSISDLSDSVTRAGYYVGCGAARRGHPPFTLTPSHPPTGLAVCGFFIMVGLVASSYIVEERQLLEDLGEELEEGLEAATL
jgi:hypothetical protein